MALKICVAVLLGGYQQPCLIHCNLSTATARHRRTFSNSPSCCRSVKPCIWEASAGQRRYYLTDPPKICSVWRKRRQLRPILVLQQQPLRRLLMFCRRCRSSDCSLEPCLASRLADNLCPANCTTLHPMQLILLQYVCFTLPHSVCFQHPMCQLRTL